MIGVKERGERKYCTVYSDRALRCKLVTIGHIAFVHVVRVGAVYDALQRVALLAPLQLG